MIVILALLGATVYGLLRGNAWSFLGAWFFGLLSVTSSFYPIADLAFEHRMYLALAAVISLVVIGGYVLATWLFRTARIDSVVWLAPALTFVVCVTCVLGYLTYKRNIVYQDTVTIWEDVLQVRKYNARAHSNYGAYLVGRSQEAQKDAERFAREDKKDEASAAKRRSEELIQSARGHLETACALDLNYADANNNLGVALYRMGDPKGAKQHYLRALEIKKDFYPEAHSNLADVLCAEGNWAQARKQYELAVANKPHYYEARKRLVSLLATCPDANVRDGHTALKHASVLVQMTNQNDVWALDLLAASYAEVGQFEPAKQVLTDVLNRLIPRLPEPERSDTRRAILMHYRYFENNQPLR
jgi:protein O-mannosyl-transferase